MNPHCKLAYCYLCILALYYAKLLYTKAFYPADGCQRKRYLIAQTDCACAEDTISATNVDDHFPISAFLFPLSASVFRFSFPFPPFPLALITSRVPIRKKEVGRAMSNL